MGRIVRDPDYRTTGAGVSVSNFTVAVDRDFKTDSGEKETDFIDCVAWRNAAEFVTKFLKKGSMVAVSGRLQIRNWTDNDGNKRRAAEVVADNVYFAESKRQADGNSDNASSLYIAPIAPAGKDYALLDGDDPQFPF
jgi:single-strand DNA-binding protein